MYFDNVKANNRKSNSISHKILKLNKNNINLTQNKNYLLRKGANNLQLYHEQEYRLLNMRKKFKKFKKDGQLKEISVPFDEPTVDKANFKSIYEGIKTNPYFTEHTLNRTKSTLEAELDNLPVKSFSPIIDRKFFGKTFSKVEKIGNILKKNGTSPINSEKSPNKSGKTTDRRKYKRNTKNYRDYFFVSSFMNKKGNVGDFIKDHKFFIYD